MRLDKLLEKNSDFHNLIKAREFPGGRVLLDVIEKLRDEQRREIEGYPVWDARDVRKDVRFKLGMIRMANLILGLPEGAFKHISKLEGREI